MFILDLQGFGYALPRSLLLERVSLFDLLDLANSGV